ncbi:MAG: hypothetical protein AAF570_08090 [Bacteroidota bacterium]
MYDFPGKQNDAANPASQHSTPTDGVSLQPPPFALYAGGGDVYGDGNGDGGSGYGIGTAPVNKYPSLSGAPPLQAKTAAPNKKPELPDRYAGLEGVNGHITHATFEPSSPNPRDKWWILTLYNGRLSMEEPVQILLPPKVKIRGGAFTLKLLQTHGIGLKPSANDQNKDQNIYGPIGFPDNYTFLGLKAFLEDHGPIKTQVRGYQKQKKLPLQVQNWPDSLQAIRFEITRLHAETRMKQPEGINLPERLNYFGSSEFQKSGKPEKYLWTVEVNHAHGKFWIHHQEKKWLRMGAKKAWNEILHFMNSSGRGKKGKGGEGGKPAWLLKLKAKVEQALKESKKHDVLGLSTDFPDLLTLQEDRGSWFFKDWATREKTK